MLNIALHSDSHTPMMTGRAGSLPDLVRLCMQPVPEHLHSGIVGCSMRCLATARYYSAQPAPAYSSDLWQKDEQEASGRDAGHSGDPGETPMIGHKPA